jgi:hypothetical protein
LCKRFDLKKRGLKRCLKGFEKNQTPNPFPTFPAQLHPPAHLPSPPPLSFFLPASPTHHRPVFLLFRSAQPAPAAHQSPTARPTSPSTLFPGHRQVGPTCQARPQPPADRPICPMASRATASPVSRAPSPPHREGHSMRRRPLMPPPPPLAPKPPPPELPPWPLMVGRPPTSPPPHRATPLPPPPYIRRP